MQVLTDCAMRGIDADSSMHASLEQTQSKYNDHGRLRFRARLLQQPVGQTLKSDQSPSPSHRSSCVDYSR